ncbi:hypothetical protein BOX15_Mlig033728g1 [Macrostomum lignano]|uniref:Frizzled-5 n=2 Tax=Macrostomum lignano TaxID=282301 RepID=A0A267FLS0_9PLAT|nr:hypothetical protein BOX15_Mlig004391g1 [Macrostomum lignano]PAA83220.1 hypothetical protein BOX15_Mlig033728g1 [Macrostomum lignano]
MHGSQVRRDPMSRQLLLLGLLLALVSACGSIERSSPPTRPLGLGYSDYPDGRTGHFGSSHIPIAGSLPSDMGSGKRCQPITIPVCQGIGYNYTFMPNHYNHETQAEAGISVHQFWPLIEIGCSQDLRFFLCSIYAPICIQNYDKHLPVCRSVCERARSGCAPLMRQYGFSWPEHMDCSRLPVFGDPDILCMDVNNTQQSSSKTPEPLSSDPTLPPADPDSPSSTFGIECDCKCRKPLVTLTEADQGYYNRVHTGGVDNCALPCEGAFFADRSQLATVWMGIWSILCAASSTLTVLTFLLDTRRFSYPERPIVMMSACYMMVSAGYILRLAVGRDAIACDGRLLRYGSTGPWLCTVVFLLTYLFGMASCVWWVMLCVAWFLAAGLKWGSEAIAKYSEVFHGIAWLLPIVQFILALTFSLVDGDPISGICSVGNTSLTALQVFVLAPMVTYLLLGSAFLLTGFVALFRIRSVIKQQACAKTYKLEKLMIRIGIFSILYTLPACVVIACHFYEAQLREAWLRGKTCRCLGQNQAPAPEPEYGVFMLRQFMQLAVGITSGVWVWSGKTLQTWRSFFYRLFCCQPRAMHSADPRPYYKFNVAPGHPPLPPLPPLPPMPGHMSQV